MSGLLRDCVAIWDVWNFLDIWLVSGLSGCLGIMGIVWTSGDVWGPSVDIWGAGGLFQEPLGGGWELSGPWGEVVALWRCPGAIWGQLVLWGLFCGQLGRMGTISGHVQNLGISREVIAGGAQVRCAALDCGDSARPGMSCSRWSSQERVLSVPVLGPGL